MATRVASMAFLRVGAPAFVALLLREASAFVASHSSRGWLGALSYVFSAAIMDLVSGMLDACARLTRYGLLSRRAWVGVAVPTSMVCACVCLMQAALPTRPAVPALRSRARSSSNDCTLGAVAPRVVGGDGGVGAGVPSVRAARARSCGSRPHDVLMVCGSVAAALQVAG